MSLNLTPEDMADYQRQVRANEEIKQDAMMRGDKLTARKARQANTAIYKNFHEKQIYVPPTPWEREQSMTLDERVSRIEQHLKLGGWSE